MGPLWIDQLQIDLPTKEVSSKRHLLSLWIHLWNLVVQTLLVQWVPFLSKAKLPSLQLRTLSATLSQLVKFYSLRIFVSWWQTLWFQWSVSLRSTKLVSSCKTKKRLIFYVMKAHKSNKWHIVTRHSGFLYPITWRRNNSISTLASRT